MATEVGSAYVSVIPSAKGFGSTLTRSVGKQVDTSGKDSGRRFGKGFSGGVGGAIGGVGRSIAAIAGPLAILGGIRVLGNFVTDARESAKISALTAQAIKSTGGVAKVTAKDVGKLSTAISNKTGIDDEQIQSGANLLLTFTNIRNELGAGNKIFDKANVAVTDMSAALGQDTKSSAIQLGKALNDPVKGITALSRVGVAFTAQQKSQIKALVASGDTLGAQKVILKELSKEFGGAAAAMATPGDKLKVSLGNVGEAIGAQLIPKIDQFAKFMVAKGIPALVRFGTFIKTNVVPPLKTFGTFVTTVVVPALGRLAGFVQRNLAFFGPFAAAIAGALVAMKIIAIVTKLWAASQLLLNIALTANPIGIVVVAIAAMVGALVYAYKNSQRFRTIVNAAFAAVKAAVMPVVNVVRVVVPKAFALLVTLVRGYINSYIAIVRRVFRVVEFIAAIPARVVSVVGNFGTVLFEAGKDLIRGLINGIKSLATAPVDAVKGIGSKVKNGFKSVLGIGSPSKVFAGFGVNINEGLLRGMQGSESLLRKGAQGSANALTRSFASSAGPRLARTAAVGHAPTADGLVVQVHNPIPEPTSESVDKVLRRKRRQAGWAAG